MISVVIVTYNRSSLLKNCLNSILSQKNCGPFEIIVVDNHSSEATTDLIRDDFPGRVKLIPTGSRVSLVKAKELGINGSSGEMIAFTDDDCVVSGNWLKEIEGSLMRNDLAGGVTLPGDVHLPCWWKGSLNWLIGINTSPGFKFLPLGSNVAFRRQVLDRIKTNTSVKELLPYGEDNDRIQKARAAGFSMGINKNMIVYHQIPGQKLTFRYLLKRSYTEGKCLVNYGNRIKDITYNLLSLPINLLRALFLLDLNRFFRVIVNGSYLINCLKFPENAR
jgi:glycosyltransferase involved in cell wall biosynthesis